MQTNNPQACTTAKRATQKTKESNIASDADRCNSAVRKCFASIQSPVSAAYRKISGQDSRYPLVIYTILDLSFRRYMGLSMTKPDSVDWLSKRPTDEVPPHHSLHGWPNSPR